MELHDLSFANWLSIFQLLAMFVFVPIYTGIKEVRRDFVELKIMMHEKFVAKDDVHLYWKEK